VVTHLKKDEYCAIVAIKESGLFPWTCRNRSEFRLL